jgi:hypothetical protein
VADKEIDSPIEGMGVSITQDMDYSPIRSIAGIVCLFSRVSLLQGLCV